MKSCGVCNAVLLAASPMFVVYYNCKILIKPSGSCQTGAAINLERRFGAERFSFASQPFYAEYTPIFSS